MNRKNINQIGEDVAVRYLTGRGYVVETKNYKRGRLNIDLVVTRGELTCFVEITSLVVRSGGVPDTVEGVDEQLHLRRLKRYSRIMSSYMKEFNVPKDKWNFIVLKVNLNMERRVARVYSLEGVVL